MNDLLQTMDLSEGQWSSSTDHLEARDEAIGSQHRKEFGSMDYASLTLTFTRGARQRSDTDTAVSSDDITQLSSEECGALRAQGVMNGSVSRPPSESSGDVSVSLDSPLRSAQHSSLDGKPAGSEQILTESTEPAEDVLSAQSSGVSRERVKSRGILRSASGRAPPGRPSRTKGSGLSSQSKALSVSVSERLDSSSGLPRASSVISTAEGSVRRTSIHDLLSKDSREPVPVAPAPSNVEVLQDSRTSKSRGGALSLS